MIKGSIPKRLEDKFRREAMETYGYFKGAVSKALEAAIELWLSSRHEMGREEELDNEAFEELVEELEAKHLGEYAAIADGRLLGVYKTLEEAFKVKSKNSYSHRVIFRVGERPEAKVRLGWRAKVRPVGTT